MTLSQINPPVVRSGGGKLGRKASAVAASAGAESVPYTGKVANASILQTVYVAAASVTTTGDGVSVAMPRRLGTKAIIQVVATVATFTANISTSNTAKDISVAFFRQDTSGTPTLDTLTAPIPLVGLASGTPYVGRWGGIVGPLLVVDDDTLSDNTVNYGAEFTVPASGFASLTFSFLLQEILV